MPCPAGESSNVYTLMWYKKKGGSVLKTLSAEVFSGLVLLTCPLSAEGETSLVYSSRDHCLHGASGLQHSRTQPVKPKDVSSLDDFDATTEGFGAMC